MGGHFILQWRAREKIWRLWLVTGQILLVPENDKNEKVWAIFNILLSWHHYFSSNFCVACVIDDVYLLQKITHNCALYCQVSQTKSWTSLQSWYNSTVKFKFLYRFLCSLVDAAQHLPSQVVLMSIFTLLLLFYYWGG